MDVILDTNTYVAVMQDNPREMFSSNGFVGLFQYLRRTRSKLVIPHPVFIEVARKYSELLQSSTDKARSAWETLQRQSMKNRLAFMEPDHEAEVEAFKQKILNLGVGFEVFIIEDYKGVSAKDLVTRGVNRTKPASIKGEELRDVAIWFFALQYAEDTATDIAFVTNDGNFRTKAGELHEDCKRDLADRDVKIKFHRLVEDFVKDNSLDNFDVSLVEMQGMIDDPPITVFINSLLNRKDFLDVGITGIKFLKARKYKVGDADFYVEVKFQVKVTYTKDVYPPLSNWILGSVYQPQPEDFATGFTLKAIPEPVNFDNVYMPTKLFNRIGQSSTQVPSPIPSKKAFEEELTMDLSFRTASGAASLQLLHTAYSEPKQLPDAPVETTA